MDDVLVIVPAYKPDEKLLLPLLEDLQKRFEHIVVIDDGCGKEYEKVFKGVETLKIKVVKHNKNYGKGRALKTGFQCALHRDYKFVVCCDCDGQHSAEDVYKCAEAVKKHPRSLILGVRDFDSKNVPLGNRIGNKITRALARIFIDLDLKDTQTGLRAMGTSLMKEFLNVWGDHFDFEMNMLITAKIKKHFITEVPIETIYLNNNISSHFRPIKDSYEVYKRLLTYTLPGLLFIPFDLLLYNYLPFCSICKTLLNILILIFLYYDVHDAYFYKINKLYYILTVVMIGSMVGMVYLVSILTPVTVYMKFLIDLLILGIFSCTKHELCHNNS